LNTLRNIGLVALSALAFGCDFGIGSGGGCARISQGDYTFPEKDIVTSSIAARVTQSGIDFLTARVKALVLSFFNADASGRAVIPLGDLGVGSLSTSLGPFDAEVRDLVLTLDLSRLEVRLVPGSVPARLEIYIENAEVGLVDGTIAGGFDGFLFSGDAACSLANGPADRVALITMRLQLEIATDTFGAIDINVLPSTFDLQDVAISLVTDCDRPECLDGQPTGSTRECLECETICVAADFAADLVSIVQQAFDGLVDQLLNSLADELANLVLNGFLNGKPLAVEGTLDIASLLSPVLRWMEGARPLGVLAKPAGQAFRVTGAGGNVGLDIVLDAGIEAASSHPCVGKGWNERSFKPGPRPTFDGLAQTPDGPVPYELGLGVSAAIINEAVWELWKSGALCIAVETDDLATLSAGKLVLTARTLDLLLPGIAGIAGPNAPVRIVVLPALDVGPDYVRVGNGSPLLTIGLANAQVAIETLVGDGWLRMISFEADLALGMALQPKLDGTIEIKIADVALEGLALPDNQIFARARLDVIAPFVVELALGFLTETPLSFDLGLSGLASGFGLPLDAIVAATGPGGDNGDWLAFYVQLRDPPTPVPMALSAVAVDASGPGWMEFRADAAADERFQVRVAGGRWSADLVGPGPHRIETAQLWLVGRWPIEVRELDTFGRVGAGAVRGSVKVLPPLMDEPAVATLLPAPAPQSVIAPVTTADGCSGAGDEMLGVASILFAATLALTRRRSHFAKPSAKRPA